MTDFIEYPLNKVTCRNRHVAAEAEGDNIDGDLRDHTSQIILNVREIPEQ